MSFYVRGVYANNRRGFGAKRIPRKIKKALRREWGHWRADPAAMKDAHETMRRCEEARK